MASSPLTLAALATSAVPGLIIHGSRQHFGTGGGEFSSAVLVCETEDLIVRVPRTPSAEVQQSAELLSLAALSAGARAELPFAVPESRGVTRAGDSRAVVSTFIAGETVAADVLDPGALLLAPLAEALAAIHHLPLSIARQNGLTVQSAEDVRLAIARIVERAEATRFLPDVVHARWTQKLREPELWDFAPTLTHGSLGIDQLLVADDTIVGILGWSELGVGDPAADLAWLLGSGPGVLQQVLDRYTPLRATGNIEVFTQRIALHHEIELAKWLLHGVDQHDSAIIDDAVALLDSLVDRLEQRTSRRVASAPLSSDEVSLLLDEVPEVSSDLSETAAYEGLDEDRMFHIDTDFIEPLPDEADASNEADASDEPHISDDPDERTGADELATQSFDSRDVPIHERPTEPIDRQGDEWPSIPNDNN